ncbi:Cupredoxin [Mycena alexandri]|uniref:Cupredoxin n=1 Tax=Mycena alexandri TaxID=1745969 RepID=A0AAD6S727_9AGAR|nr:Cupredoxin [Mycena alexandri]KAJ7022399.1 Cupredoxin [Mycena alexandri]
MLFFALATLVSAVSAANISVKVGDNGTLAFDPPSVTAAQGDTIVFQFLAKNHSVTQSTFAAPCAVMTTPMAGIDSGFQFVAANATQIPQYSFTVNNATSPLWFFCAQTNPVSHCAKGMVFAVNAPTTGAKTFSAFQAAAMGASNASVSGSAPAASGTPPPSGALMTRASVVGVLAVAAAGAFTLL